MKNFTLKLISFLVILCMAFSVFAQRGRSSFGGSSGGFGGGRTSYSAPRSSSSSSFRQPSSTSSTFGGGRQQAVIPSRPSTSNYRPSTSNYRPSTSNYRPSTSNRVTATNRVSYRSSYRVGYRPSVSVHYYGSPFGYMGHMLYWYGGGYYAYSPGGALMMGSVGMPGYQQSYNYDPGYASQPVQNGVGYQQPVVVVSSGPSGFTIFCFVMLGLFAVAILAQAFR